MKILIIKTGALGDVLRTTVILEGLVEKYVNPKIYWLTSEGARTLIDNNPFIEKIYYKENLDEDIFTHRYDLVISLEEDKELLMLINKMNKKKLFGVYLDNDGLLKYTDDSSAWYNMSLISKFGRIVADDIKKSNIFSYPEKLYKMLGLEWHKQRYRLFLIKKEIKYADDFKKNFDATLPVIGIVIGAGNRWPMKSLPVDKTIQLIKSIHERYEGKAHILCLTGSAQLELENISIIKKECPFVLTHDVQDISEFIGIVNLCNVVIAPDTLSMHIAIGLNKYVIAYFTVTSAAEIEIYTGKKIIAKHQDYCSYTKENKPRPNITDNINLNDILTTLEQVIKT